LMLVSQPAHLQARAGRALESAERDQARAALVRETLGVALRAAMRRQQRKS